MRGGKRENAGRKSLYNEPTKGVWLTIPISKIKEVKQLVKNYLKQYEHNN
jgi:hypothetical protein